MDKPSSTTLLPWARSLAEELVEELGQDRVRCVFLAGSVAEGRVAAAWVEGTLEVYSDLDLYVVLASGQDLEEARKRARRMAARFPFTAPELRLFKPPDIGVYDPEDLARQPARPGTLAAAAKRIVLYGEPPPAGWPARGSIDPREGLYLLENRMLELALLEERHGEPGPWDRYRRYQLIKAALDAGTAALLATGHFHLDLEARWQMLGELRSTRPLSGLLTDERWKALRWAREALDRLEGVLFLGRQDWKVRQEQLQALVMDTWAEVGSWLHQRPCRGELLEARARGTSIMKNLKEAKISLVKHGVSPLVALRVWLKGPALSPRNVARLAGVCTLLQASGELVEDNRVVSYLEALRKALGTGSPLEAGARLGGLAPGG